MNYGKTNNPKVLETNNFKSVGSISKPTSERGPFELDGGVFLSPQVTLQEILNPFSWKNVTLQKEN